MFMAVLVMGNRAQFSQKTPLLCTMLLIFESGVLFFLLKVDMKM